MSKMIEINKRCEAAFEIYTSLVEKAREMLIEHFGKPTAYYDAERQRALSVAHDIFGTCVTIEDILELAKEKPDPFIEKVSVEISPRDAQSNDSDIPWNDS